MRHDFGAAVRGRECAGMAIGIAMLPASVAALAVILELDARIDLLASAAIALPALLGALFSLRRARRTVDGDARRLARRHVHHFELRLHEAMQALEQAHAQLQLACGNLLYSRHQPFPPPEKAALQRQLRTFRAQFERVTEQCVPRAWGRDGLRGALGDGPIAQALEAAGMDYHLGPLRGVEHWSAVLQLELYRLACACVAALLEQGGTSLQLRLRGGFGRDRAWAVLSVQSDTAGGKPEAGRHAALHWLGTLPETEALADAALLGEGRLRLREWASGRRRISVLLLDLAREA